MPFILSDGAQRLDRHFSRPTLALKNPQAPATIVGY